MGHEEGPGICNDSPCAEIAQKRDAIRPSVVMFCGRGEGLPVHGGVRRLVQRRDRLILKYVVTLGGGLSVIVLSRM
jgi:hypothetical protein